VPKPEGVTDEQYEQYLEERAREKVLSAMDDRIRREGFETGGWDPDDGEICIRATTKKPRNRCVTEPCGAKAFIGLTFRTPENPEGVRIPLCRRCLVAELKNLMGYLD
jgi:hypothetical protein